MIVRSLGEIPLSAVSHNEEILKRVLLADGDCPPVMQFAQARFGPGQVAPAHRHEDMVEVFLVTSGVATVTTERGRESFAAGTCFVCEVGEEHEVANVGSEDLVLTYFGVKVGSV